MPTLDGLINRGVIGNLATLQPILSPMLWNSIATGKFPDKHGIHGFIEPDPVNGGARPYTSISRKCKAVWNILTQSDLRSNIVGWWASHPAEAIRGTVVTNAFGGVKYDPEGGWRVPPGAVHPAEQGPLLARFKVFPTEFTSEHILPFIPRAALIDQQEDPRLQTFARILSDAASVHAVATALMETEEWDFTAVYYDAIDHFSHAFMPFHPPRLEWVTEEDFQLYKDVVRGAYRFHDMMLERLLQLAGPETTVILCSDHGFESGTQRPMRTPREPAGPAVWHRQYGILVMAGPGIKRDERIYGASLIDITPTVLTLFRLPIGEDMDGRPLLEAFEEPPTVETIPSWDALPGESGMHAEGTHVDPDQALELMQQFAALGYIEDPSADAGKMADSAEVEGKYNIASTHLWRNRPDRALPLLEEIVRRRPWEERFLLQLSVCYLQNGYLAQAERVLTAIAGGQELRGVSALLIRARIRIGRGDLGAALSDLLAADALNPRNTSVLTHLGDVYSRLYQWVGAKAAYERAIHLDADNALAYQGLSSVYRRLGLNQETAEAALHALSLLHRLPFAHFNLGVAMARSGDDERAILAFETALRFQPHMVNAHRFLALLHRGRDGAQSGQALFHREEAERLLRERGKVRTMGGDVSEVVFPLPEIPNREERLAILLRERPDPKPPEKRSGKTFVLVSGLPRSGTSLMMQMLEAGGSRILCDGERAADIDNPKGYYEWEPIKQIGKRPELLDEALDGHAFKCVSMLLQQLPVKHSYKVIFMTRPVEEVVDSQNAMVTRLATKGAELDPEQLQRGLTAHRDELRSWLRSVPHMASIEIDYPTLILDPSSAVARIAELLGPDLLPAPERMAAVVDPSLHRRRQLPA